MFLFKQEENEEPLRFASRNMTGGFSHVCRWLFCDYHAKHFMLFMHYAHYLPRLQCFKHTHLCASAANPQYN